MKATGYVCSLGAACVLTKLLLYYQRHRCLPRRFKRGRFIGNGQSQRSDSASAERDGYTSKKAGIDGLDVVIVGSGIGGLTCAALLSRAGWRCLVLEQHYIAGGCTHMFEDKGYEFDTGLHYVGNISRRQKYLDLACIEPISWAQMGSREDGYVYDEIVVGPNNRSTSVKFPAGRDALVAALEAAFPGQRSSIERWFDVLLKVSKSDTFLELKIVWPKFIAKLLNRLLSGSFFRYVRRGVKDALVECVPEDSRLRSVLLGQFGNYCSKPGDASLYTHATVAMHYLAGGWYPKGGSVEIARKMIPTIERTGGRVLVRKGVEQILVEGGRAAGVVMENGNTIRAPVVISACGAANTWKKLVPEAHVPPGFREKIENIGQSATIYYLFIGLEGSSAALDLPSWNIWRWPTDDDHDLDAMISKFQADPEHAPVPLFCGFPSSKDPTFESRYPEKSTAVLLTIGSPQWTSKWEHTKWGKRGQDYEAFKNMLTSRILEEGLYYMWPQTRGHVAYTALGTSLTYNHFIRSLQGEAYGLGTKPDRFQEDDWLRPESPVPGLFLTGQDVAVFGIAGALMSGVLSAMAVLGYGSPLDVASGRNLVEDLWHLDATQSSEYSERSQQHIAAAYSK
eukprot:TRINITY_DN37276_c0_g1_i1.p1 TRINITY_DN37276_c0_g1~~TRINITY_DN37276_c0_g1_i1.p1  ORF type:complete len:646 (-),score=89.29 TRINITY_DN37276_c0_g1_i1:138-2006(-)